LRRVILLVEGVGSTGSTSGNSKEVAMKDWWFGVAGGVGYVLAAGAMEAGEAGFLPAGVLLAVTGVVLATALVMGLAVAILWWPEPVVDPGPTGALPWVAAVAKEG
jgi:NhaP-type Na+/H+ or K+/H+ antiporter